MIIASSFNWPRAHQHSGWWLIPTDLKAPGLKTQINLIPDCPQCGIRMTRTRPFPGSRSQEDDGRIRWPSGLQYLLMAILLLISTLLPNGFLYIGSSEVFIHESVGLTSTQWNIPRGWQIWAMGVYGIVIISNLCDPDQHFNCHLLPPSSDLAQFYWMPTPLSCSSHLEGILQAIN